MGYSNQHELERRVNRFCYDNQEDLRQVVKGAYSRYTLSGVYDDDMRRNILRDSDFPVMIGFPLFLLFLATSLCAYFPNHSIRIYILAVFFIAFGFLIRIYVKHAISLTSWRLFRMYRYPSVVREYVNNFREPEIYYTESPTDKTRINEFYDECIKKFESSYYFNYLHQVKNYKLDRESKKRK